MNIVSANIEQLKYIFPEVFTDGKIDFDVLKALLGEYIEDRDERYGFNWNGKSKARMISQTPSIGTLRPCPAESIEWDTTQNLFIEGDNLEILKLLQKSYYKKVKMIFIDPPYNTGNEFIYPDKYQDNLSTYLHYTGQIDNEGFKFSTNSETSGRYHTNWLNMMYPRMKLAKNLLKDDGVIFISIDDNEVANLRNICDEIFGEENFVAKIPWRKRTAKSDVPFGVSQDYEWILCYAKTDQFKASKKGSPRKYYESPDFPNKPWRIHDMTKQTSASERPNSYFTMVNPKTGEEYPANPNNVWRITKDTFQKYYEESRIIFPGDYAFLKISNPVLRYFKEDDQKNAGDLFGFVPLSTHLPTTVGMTQDGTKEMNQLFQSKNFPFPKPVNLIKYFIECVSAIDKSAIIFDFFAGSCTTAHAVLDLNKEDGGNRKFIMVQLPEPCDKDSEASKAGYKTIAEIGKERIRRAIKKIKEESPDYKGDLGFKVFKLDSTNIKPWDVDEDNLQTILEDYISNIKDGRSEHDVLYEILLKYGLDLTLPVEERKIAGKNVFVIGAGALIICLDDDITLDVVEGIVKLKEELQPEIVRVVFKDLGFKGDVVKTNTLQILKLAGIDDVKSI